MKSGKKALLTLVITALTSGYAFADVDGGSGKITFTGSIINAPCAIEPDDIDKQVVLGEIPASYINTNGHSDAVDASLHLINCDLPNSDNGSGEAVTKVDVTFSSDSVTTEDSSLLSNTFASGATNVGVRLLDKTSTIITLGTAKTIDLIPNSGTEYAEFDTELLTREKSYQAELSQVTGDTVKTGPFETAVLFKINYN